MAEDFSHIGDKIKELDVGIKGKGQGLQPDGFEIKETDLDIKLKDALAILASKKRTLSCNLLFLITIALCLLITFLCLIVRSLSSLPFIKILRKI